VAAIKSNGRVYRHESFAPDDYVGKVKNMHSLAEGGAAFFLLLLPSVEGGEIEANKDKADESEANESDTSEGE
jgi:hypothetical protein